MAVPILRSRYFYSCPASKYILQNKPSYDQMWIDIYYQPNQPFYLCMVHITYSTSQHRDTYVDLYWKMQIVIDPSRGIYMIQMVNFVSCKHAMRLNHRPLFQSNLCISWKCVRESASHYVVAIEYQHIYNSRIRIFIINDTGRQCRIIAYVLINWLYMKDHYLVWCWWGRLYYVFNLQWDECI